MRCDFQSADDLAALLARMDEMNLDALVNNALPAPLTTQHFHKMPLDAFQTGFRDNVVPTVSVTQKAINLFRQKRAGRIVTVLTATLVGRPPAGYSEYTAAKAYLHQLAKAWAVENASFGITSNCVSPAFMATRLTRNTDERIVADMVRRHPLKRLLETSEVAEAVEFLLTCSAHINGVNVALNAGSEIA
jgi:NAD(P)-dependent dehydrogenase (short-subunit alcohol dehydrogenase family)